MNAERKVYAPALESGGLQRRLYRRIEKEHIVDGVVVAQLVANHQRYDDAIDGYDVYTKTAEKQKITYYASRSSALRAYNRIEKQTSFFAMKLYKGKALPKKRWVCWQAWILFAIIVIVGLIESP